MWRDVWIQCLSIFFSWHAAQGHFSEQMKEKVSRCFYLHSCGPPESWSVVRPTAADWKKQATP